MDRQLFTKDFTLVVIGQVISLFGNAAVRFVLPLYLLNETGSSALFGTVMACAFIPSVLLSPIGGIVADRVNKRNIMVVLDFLTAGLILLFTARIHTGDLIVHLTVTLMLLYGIAGAYQPAVQSSIPALVEQEQYIAANSVINTVNAVSSLIGPALGGVLYSAFGLGPVLWVCVGCFFLSAVMELFIHIPHTKQSNAGGIWRTVKSDFSDSLRFICRERSEIGKAMLVLCGINLFLSAMIVVAIPYLVTEVLPLNSAWANRLCGFAESALAAGGLVGGILAGVFAGRLTMRRTGNLLIVCALCALPMGTALALVSSGVVNYAVIVLCCFLMMACSSMFSVRMMAFVQKETPPVLIGKVISVIMTVAMCAQPLGNAMYGVLFERCSGFEFVVVQFAGLISLLIAVPGRHLFTKLE